MFKLDRLTDCEKSTFRNLGDRVIDKLKYDIKLSQKYKLYADNENIFEGVKIGYDIIENEIYINWCLN